MKNYAIGCLLAVLSVSCNDVGKNSDSPVVRTNTLSGESFTAKVTNGSEIYKGIGNLRGAFAGGKLKAFTSPSMLTMIDDSEGEIDLTDPGCKLVNTETKTFGNISYTIETHECSIVREGKQLQCTIALGKDASGNEISREHSCTSSSSSQPNPDPNSNSGSTQPTAQGGQARSYLPTTSDITDCESAFDMFESLYSQSKADYEAMAATFADPKSHADQYSSLKSVSPAADEAVAYELVPQEQMEGLKVQGRFAGGGTETALLMRHKVEMTMDFSKMFANTPGLPFPTGEEPAVEQPSLFPAGTQTMAIDNTFDIDLASSVAKSAINMTMSQTTGETVETQSVMGVVTVSNGAEKFVTQDLAVKIGGTSNEELVAKLTARLIDADTLRLDGEFRGPGAPGTVNVIVKKSATGSCTVASDSK